MKRGIKKNKNKTQTKTNQKIPLLVLLFCLEHGHTWNDQVDLIDCSRKAKEGKSNQFQTGQAWSRW